MNRRLAIGVDLGGTNTRAALVSSSGRVISIHSRPTRAQREVDRVMADIAKGAMQLLAENGVDREEVAGIGLGAPGFLSLSSGVIHSSPNLPTVRETPVVSLLKKLTDLPVYLENDANAAAIGEHWVGAGRGSRNLLCVTLGTGVGSGFILDGTIWHGSNGLAGELGHTTLFPDGLSCKCGKSGCLEAYVSATGIVTRALSALKEGRHSSLESFLDREETSLTALVIYEHAQRGDRLARDLFEETGRYLAIAIVNVLNMLDLEMVILGGQVARSGDLLVRPTVLAVQQEAIGAQYHPVKIVTARLGNHAGVIGSAKTAFDGRSKNQGNDG